MIFVLAGVNGAGKSSIGGAAIREAGQEWYDPDALARTLRGRFPEMPIAEINSRVWREGLRRLRAAIRDDTDFTFETTLGGRTVTETLFDAIAAGVEVSIWYCGLETVELHIERVAARVARGGHAIPEDLIRARYRTSMSNLCRLAPGLYQLGVHDNSLPLDSRNKPSARRLLHVLGGEICQLESDMPDWARPVATVCLTAFG